MHARKRQPTISLAFLLAVIATASLKGQSSGWIAGIVHDRSGDVIPGAEVRIQSESTGARQKIYCDASGGYISTQLLPGVYKVTVRHEGFRTIAKGGLTVRSGKMQAADFVLDVLPLQQKVTVQANHDNSDPNASGLTVSRGSPQSTLPANGRDLHGVFTLMPGAITTPAPTSDGGQFSVTGQRATTNSFRIDGISGNAGIGFVSTPGPFPGTTLPGMTTIGSTHSLASQEETERVEMKALNFAPEYGERPGAQISVETRSGSNEFHGSALGYFRPRLLDSRDWFAQNYSVNLPSASLNGWGGSLGGPIIPNRTFFFASLERTNVHDTALHLLPVPSLESRAAVGSSYKPFLDAFPLPIGPALNSAEATGAATLLKQGKVANNSLRLDQMLGSKAQFFARYTNVPSSATTTELQSSVADFHWLSATGGLNMVWGRVTQQFRFNYSRAIAVSEYPIFVDTGQTLASYYITQNLDPSKLQLVTNPAYLHDVGSDITSLSLAGVGQILSGRSGQSTQSQMEEAYNLSLRAGRHEFRAGADYIKLHANPGVGNTTLSLVAGSTEALLAGDPLAITLSDSFLGPVGVKTVSLFAQDTWRWSERLTILYGLRQEITPPPSILSGFLTTQFPYVGYWNGLGTTPTTVGQTSYNSNSSWPVNYTQLAPRLGIAYRWKTPDLVLRAGGGTFFDTSFASAINANNANASSNWQFFPLNGASNLAAGTAEAPLLRIPRVWEWRTSVEKSVHSHSLLSLSYLGSAGRSLMRKQAFLEPQTSLLQTINFTNNGRSDYQALQAQFTGNLTRNLYVLLSYTWSHSIDNGSRDTAVFLAYPGYNNAIDRGSSNFDIRHAASASLEYRLPAPKFSSFLRPLLGNWNVSSTLQARTGFPFDVTTIDRSIGLGFDNTGRPDLVAGVPLWLPNSAVPGGRQLNPAAFRIPQNAVSGTLGRNVLTGPGLFQIDMRLRRQWKLYRGSTLEGSVAAFNTLNRSSFANPVGYLGSALFGQPVSTMNLMLGSGTPTTGLTPIFQAGGPRTVELSIKIHF